MVVAFEWVTAGRVYVHAGLYFKAFQHKSMAQSAHAAEDLDNPRVLYCRWKKG